jgi:hypothetical protein
MIPLLTMTMRALPCSVHLPSTQRYFSFVFCQNPNYFQIPTYDIKQKFFISRPTRTSHFSLYSLNMLLFGTILFDRAVSKSFQRSICSSHYVDSDESQVYAPEWVKLMKTPGDGSCLFHAVSASLSGKIGNAQQIRIRVVDSIPKLASSKEFNGATLQQWIEWETGLSPSAYASQMLMNSAWGGQVCRITQF